MSNIANNPHHDSCPDYTLDVFQTLRKTFVDKGLTEGEAVNTLKGSWEAQNAIAKARWDQQEIERLEIEAEEARRAEEAAQLRKAAELEEAEAALKEERKKNRAKYLPVSAGVGMPDRPTVRFPSSVLQKLRKGDYVDLWYATDAGLTAMLQDVGSVQSQRLAVERDEDGLITYVPEVTLKASKALVRDEDLAWDQFPMAYMRLIPAMRDAGWESDRVNMFAKFWSSLHLHPWATALDSTGVDRHALLIYQAEQRRQWHLIVQNDHTVPDLTVINEFALHRARDEAMKQWQEKRMVQMESRMTAYARTQQAADSGRSRPSSNRRDRSDRRDRRDRRRSASPSSHRQSRPRSRSRSGSRSRNKRDFRSGAGSSPVFPPCAVCLGRHRHADIGNCQEKRTWDDKHTTVSQRHSGALTLIAGNKALCGDWNATRGCTSTSHPERHVCSGCSSLKHGAQDCPRAQPLSA
ncbi:hypothetical protein DFP72DRAFT_1123256 [Ephemerocybe angulata]|uniref:Uncharacterized protein n=1 Tax=Ephemerocybe angulata TaxID=980116 RepID=A0A8H6H6P2_9AGAR|nr:hypothetical protein DFP72DRAFT_1123256 [Tulosesus angulatus]